MKRLRLVLEADNVLIEDRPITRNVKATALRMLLAYAKTLPADDPPAFWIYLMFGTEVLCEYVLRDDELECQQDIIMAAGGAPPDVQDALEVINRHRRRIGQPQLDPTAAGWEPDDILAEAETIRRLHPRSNPLKQRLLR